jgi:hypothetical protein
MQTIPFGGEGREATRELVARFESAAPAWSATAPARVDSVRRQLATLEALDRSHGGHARLAVEDAATLVAQVRGDLAQVEVEPRGPTPDEAMADVVLGTVLWAVRHAVEIGFVEPVVNALAVRSNAARSREELAAAFALAQGVIAQVAPRLAADLERSNPERPWRLLHVNLAITAIRTEDPAMMAFAFDALERALPDEACGFFSEALALSLAPGIAAPVRDAIAERHRRCTEGG